MIRSAVSAGALICGQCPVAFSFTRVLFVRFRYMYSPTGSGAMSSCEHCRIRAGTLALERSVTIIGKKSHAREVLRDSWVRPAEAVGQFLRELRPFSIFHNDWCNRLRPAKMVLVKRPEQTLYLRPGKPANIVVVVYVAGRGSHKDERLESFRPPDGGKDTDQRAHGVPDEDYGSSLNRVDNVEDISGVPVECSIFLPAVLGQIRIAGADVIEKHNAVAIDEGRDDEAPHCLIATIPVRKQNRLRSTAEDVDVVLCEN